MMRRNLFLLCFLCLVATNNFAATTLSPQTFKVLQQIEQLLDRKAYGDAIAKTKKQLESVSVPLEKSLLLHALASAYVLQGKHLQASKALEQALATGALPETQRAQVLYTLGQLYLGLDQPGKAVKALEQWLQSAPRVQPQDRVMLAQAYAQLKHYRKALRQINRALQETNQPQEEWIALRLAIHYQLKNYQAAAADAKTLIRLHPDRERFWQQLVGLYQLAGHPMTATAAMELESHLGLLDEERELLNLISLLRAIHTPYLAALRLKTAINQHEIRANYKHLDLLATLWAEAREFERAIQTLKRAAKLSHDSKIWLRLGQLYYEQEKWQEAADALRTAIQRGKLENPGKTWLLLGTVYLELEQWKHSRQAFQQARKYPKTKRFADQWLNYLAHLPIT